MSTKVTRGLKVWVHADDKFDDYRRILAEQAWCPDCDAPPGQPCVDHRYKNGFHLTRELKKERDMGQIGESREEFERDRMGSTGDRNAEATRPTDSNNKGLMEYLAALAKTLGVDQEYLSEDNPALALAARIQLRIDYLQDHERFSESPSAGINEIRAERVRQVNEEGWTPEHDAEHDEGELVAAAIHYAEVSRWMASTNRMDGALYFGGGRNTAQITPWPWDGKWWKPNYRDPVANLIKAGALIAAEIDRITVKRRTPAEQMRHKILALMDWMTTQPSMTKQDIEMLTGLRNEVAQLPRED